MYAEARGAEVVLAEPKKSMKLNKEGVPVQQSWEMQRQRPGCGELDVECLHKGPTLVAKSICYYIILVNGVYAYI